jgi:undecaprenyl diphosphate synthase
MSAAEGKTSDGQRLLLRLAIDYSGRDAILAAALAGPKTRREFQWNLDRAIHATTSAPSLDLLIRTGGERRLSDFMLWESAYAELVFTDVPWPAFTAAELSQAVEEFRQRDRRFGAVRPARSNPDRSLTPAATPASRGYGAGSLVLPGVALPHHSGR